MKKVVITGGNGDIAKAIANELNHKKFEIFLPTQTDLDVTNEEQANNYMQKIKPDILINNAGAIIIENIKENNIKKHKLVLDVNLLGTFVCTGAALKANPKIKIVNIASSAATTPHGGWSSYCASKAAVVMASKCWAQEGLDVICISPGRTHTKMRTSMYPDEDANTLMTPEDFAKALVKIIDGNYEKGVNIDINIKNVKEYMK